jgi:cyclase
LNTTHSNNSINDFIEILRDIDSWHIATPLSYGGGIISVADAVEIIKAGAERVVVSSKLLRNSNIFSEMCSYLGDQALILHLPIEFTQTKISIKNDNASSLKSVIDLLPDNWGGEIMLSFVGNDGAKCPDWQNLSTVMEGTLGYKNFILAGGFSSAEDLNRGLAYEQVSAIAVGNYLHRTELSVKKLKLDIDKNIKLRPTL